MSEHRRTNDQEDFSHLRSDDVPAWIKWAIYAIEKVGVTAVVTFCLLYMMFVTMGRSTTAINNLSLAMDRQSASLEALIITVNANHAEGKNWREDIKDQIHDIRLRLK